MLKQLRELEKQGRDVGNYGWVDEVVSRVEIAEAKARTAGVKRVRWAGNGPDGSMRAATAAQKARAFVTNYNTVDSVLLFSAVLVCLAGIMLEVRGLAVRQHRTNHRSSSTPQSTYDNRDYFAVQRDTITWAVVALIAFSVAYFLLMLITEICSHLNPRIVTGCLNCLSALAFWRPKSQPRPPDFELREHSGETPCEGQTCQYSLALIS